MKKLTFVFTADNAGHVEIKSWTLKNARKMAKKKLNRTDVLFLEMKISK